MSQESDERALNRSPEEPAWDEPEAEAPPNAPFSPPLPRPVGQGAPPGQHYPPARPGLFEEDERRARLRELRQRRQQAGYGPLPPGEFQRRGLPTPPSQPPLKEVLKQWWERGPFAGNVSPSSNAPEKGSPALGSNREGFPQRSGSSQVLEEHAKVWLAQGRKAFAALNVRTQGMVGQAKKWLDERNHPPPPPPLPPEEKIVPGLIVIGFTPEISRQEGVQCITTFGGKPLRYRPLLNLYQVAVPPGQERAMIQQYLQQPGVVSADVERPRIQR